MFQEDEKYIYITSLEEIKTLEPYKNSKYGANSNIYIYKENELLKVFNEKESIRKLKDMEYLQEIKTTNIVKPNKFLFINHDFYGFSMDIIKGSMLAYINPTTHIKDFLKSLLNVEEDLRKLSKKYLCNTDLNALNIIYSREKKQSYVIDSNSIYYFGNRSYEQCLINNLIALYLQVLSVLSKVASFEFTDNMFLLRTREQIKYYTDFIINIEEYFNYIKEALENYVDEDINTIADFRKSLKLINE